MATFRTYFLLSFGHLSISERLKSKLAKTVKEIGKNIEISDSGAVDDYPDEILGLQGGLATIDEGKNSTRIYSPDFPLSKYGLNFTPILATIKFSDFSTHYIFTDKYCITQNRQVTKSFDVSISPTITILNKDYPCAARNICVFKEDLLFVVSSKHELIRFEKYYTFSFGEKFRMTLMEDGLAAELKPKTICISQNGVLYSIFRDGTGFSGMRINDESYTFGVENRIYDQIKKCPQLEDYHTMATFQDNLFLAGSTAKFSTLLMLDISHPDRATPRFISSIRLHSAKLPPILSLKFLKLCRESAFAKQKSPLYIYPFTSWMVAFTLFTVHKGKLCLFAFRHLTTPLGNNLNLHVQAEGKDQLHFVYFRRSLAKELAEDGEKPTLAAVTISF